MTIPCILAAICVALSLTISTLRVLGHRRLGFALKCLAAALFLLTAALGAGQRAQPLGHPAIFMIVGLAFGSIGDVFLGLAPLVAKEKYSLYSTLGGIPFFIGHFFFIAALMIGVPLRWPLLLLLPLLPVLYMLLNKMKIIDLGKKIIPIMGYGLILGAMMLASINYAAHAAAGAGLPMAGTPVGILLWFSGILFAVSDTSLFLRNFGNKNIQRRAQGLEFAVMLPYFSAQAIFALAVAYV